MLNKAPNTPLSGTIYPAYTQQYNQQYTSLTSFWFLYCYLWTNLKPSFSVSIVNIEQVYTDKINLDIWFLSVAGIINWN